MWRSLVAYTAGGRVVAGSNPVIPTSRKPENRTIFRLIYLSALPVVDLPKRENK